MNISLHYNCFITRVGGYAKFTGLKTYNKNLKTMLAIGGWNEGSTRFSPMVGSRERRKEFVRNAIKVGITVLLNLDVDDTTTKTEK